MQVFAASVRAASSGLWRPARESNHGGSVPSMESETLRQRSDIDGLLAVHSIFGPRSSLRIEVLQDGRRQIGPHRSVAD